MSFDNLMEDKQDGEQVGLSPEEMDLIVKGLGNRLSFRTNEL